MLGDVDEALRKLFIREIPIRDNQVDVTFDQPKREWSARISQPTLNLFLYDVRENKTLRQTRPMWEVMETDDGTPSRRRRPVRMDLHYMISAWAAEPEDEHQLLSGALMSLMRYPHLPEELLPETLRDQPVPIPLMAAQYDEMRNPADIWSAMDNEVKPALVCIITIAVNPYMPVPLPKAIVSPPEFSFRQTEQPREAESVVNLQENALWTVGGLIQTKLPLNTIHLTVAELRLELPIRADGRFVIEGIHAGSYTLNIEAKGQEPRQQRISIPAPDYTVEV